MGRRVLIVLFSIGAVFDRAALVSHMSCVPNASAKLGDMHVLSSQTQRSVSSSYSLPFGVMAIVIIIEVQVLEPLCSVVQAIAS